MSKSALTKLNRCLSWMLTLFLSGIGSSCVFGQLMSIKNNSDVRSTQNNSEDIKQNKILDKSRIFKKEEGWSIPSLIPSKTTKFSIKPNLQAKRKVAIDATDYVLSADIVTKEPFASIKMDLGQIEYLTVREYKIKNHIFSYKIQATRVLLDENTNKIKLTSGSVFFFAYYDEDGDGKFESLVLDETISGITKFSDPPHIPQWVLK